MIGSAGSLVRRVPTTPIPVEPRTPLTTARTPLAGQSVSDIDGEELQGVLADIAARLHGDWATLTLHPSDRPAQLLYADRKSGLDGVVGGLLQSGVFNWHLRHADQHFWIGGDFAALAPEAIVLPVRPVQGHGRLAITVFFATLDGERRAAAEAACLHHRSSAMSYLRLWQQERLLRRRTVALSAALDRVKVAVMLINKAGELAFSNEAARRLLRSGNGIHEQRGQLRAFERVDSITLAVSVAHVIEASEQPGGSEVVPLFTVKRADQAPLVVAVLPVPYPVTEQDQTAALVVAVDPDLEIREYASAVCRVFGLTRMETELACELASGVALQQAAAKLRIKEDTARGYLRTIFAKTGTNRQVDLVRMILVSLVRA